MGKYVATPMVYPLTEKRFGWITSGNFMGRSFLVGLCESAHRTGLERPAHQPTEQGVCNA